MPGYVLHLLHGKFFLRAAQLHFSEHETTLFRIGLLMPDSNKAARVPDDRSHFYPAGQEENILQTPDLRCFPYCGRLDDPFVLGYAAHLYLDRFFFGEYFPQCVQFLDAAGRPTPKRSLAVRARLEKTQQLISVPELFSEAYLYGDYTMLNRYITEHFQIGPVQEVPFESPVAEVQPENLRPVLQALDTYLQGSGGSTQMRVFCAESLIQAVDRYAFGFAQWVEGLRCGRALP